VLKKGILQNMATRLEGIKCNLEPLCIALHPNRDILAAGLVNGKVEIHDYSLHKDNADITRSRDNIIEDKEEELSIASGTSGSSNGNHGSNSNIINPSPLLEKSTSPSSLLSSLNVHTKKSSCRSISYCNKGLTLYTAGSDSSLCAIDVETNKILYTLDETHPDKCSINRMVYIPPFSSLTDTSSSSSSSLFSSELLATGDDNGVIRIWDASRTSSSSSSSGIMLGDWNDHEDFVSGFAIKDYNILSSSSDGSICVYDLRKTSSSNNNKNKALIQQSDYQQDELLCISIIKNGKKVVCGTADGSLVTFTWNFWTDPDDKYGGHPESIDSIINIKDDEDTIITASSDGLLRLVQIHPNSLLGVIANHYDDFPVEGVSLSNDCNIMATFSHDNYVRLWDTSILIDNDENDSDNDGSSQEELESSVIQNQKENSSIITKKTVNDNNKVKRSSDDEWDDDDEDSDSDEDSDDSDNETCTTNDGNKKQRTFKNDNEMFFADL